MSESPHPRAKELFLAALDLPEAERADFLRTECGGDEALLRRIERLLTSHARAERSGVLDAYPATSIATPFTEPRTAAAPDPERIGPFRIVRRLGEGGMGVVYLAEQEEPIRRMVALKLVKAGMDSRQVLARFESERQALARMTHPNIARILDAGTSEDGLPFFVMEYVPGEPITAFCDARRLPLRDRLGLFRQVCDAVQHAHQKGVIHRDMKPSNVLVSELDGKPTPKIIDFGVAKAVEQPDAVEDAYQTMFGQLVGTPDYMSPEQADPLARDIDTRADVYALGVVLYQLLCGALPFEFSGSGKGIAEIQRTIQTVDAPAPSARLAAATPEAARDAAAERATSVPVLLRALRGDLDWIALRALEKERERRYASAAELGAEIERHLRGEPVLAGSPGTAYVVRKFVRRHRLGVGLAATALMALMVFAVTMAAKNRIIADERDRANEATTRALAEAETARKVTALFASVFEVASPDVARGRDLTAREILATGVRRVRTELDDQPEVKVRLLGTLGAVHRGIGRYEESRELLVEALELSREHLGDEHRVTLWLAGQLAQTCARSGDYREARRLLESVLEAAPRVFGPDARETMGFEENLIEADIDEGRDDEAIQRGTALLERERRVLGDDQRQTLSLEGLLALAELGAGQREAAAARYEKLIPRQQAVFGEDHPTPLAAMHNLIRAYIELHRLDDATALCDTALRLRKQVFGPEHPETLATWNTKGIILLRKGDLDAAEDVFTHVIEAWRRRYGDDHPARLSAMLNLVEVYARKKQFDKAEPLAREALEGSRQAFASNHPRLLSARQTHAFVLFDEGRVADAVAELEPLFEDQRDDLGAADPRTVETADTLCSAYAELGELAKAEDLNALTAEALTVRDAAGSAKRLVAAALCAAAERRTNDAMAHLRRAADLGVKVAPFSKDPVFAVLTTDPEFAALAARLER